MSKRIGPKMKTALDYIRRHPGCAILPVAEWVGPHGSRRYGYEIVHRVIDAGLVKASRGADGKYRLTATAPLNEG